MSIVIPRTMKEMELQEKVERLERENRELRLTFNLPHDGFFPGSSIEEPQKVDKLHRDMKLATMAGFKPENIGGDVLQFYACTDGGYDSDKYELAMYVDRATIISRDEALHAVDYVARNVQSKLLATLRKNHTI